MGLKIVFRKEKNKQKIKFRVCFYKILKKLVKHRPIILKIHSVTEYENNLIIYLKSLLCCCNKNNANRFQIGNFDKHTIYINFFT